MLVFNYYKAPMESLFGSKPEITKQDITDIINYLKKENKITQERIDLRLERKKLFREDIEMDKEILESLSVLPDKLQEILKHTTIIRRQDDMQFLDSDVEHLIIDIENRDKIIKILKEFV